MKKNKQNNITTNGNNNNNMHDDSTPEISPTINLTPANTPTDNPTISDDNYKFTKISVNGTGTTNEKFPDTQHMRSKPVFFVGDKVRLKNKVEGKVTSIGARPDREGEWVRLTVENTQDDTDHRDSMSKPKAMWIPALKIEQVLQSYGKYKYTVGDRVCVSKQRNLRGTIRYFGPVHFDKGVWYGLELDEKNGANNGTVKNKFYFACPVGYGIFVLPKKIERDISNEPLTLNGSVNGAKKNTKSPTNDNNSKTPKQNQTEHDSNDNSNNEKIFKNMTTGLNDSAIAITNGINLSTNIIINGDENVKSSPLASEGDPEESDIIESVDPDESIMDVIINAEKDDSKEETMTIGKIDVKIQEDDERHKFKDKGKEKGVINGSKNMEEKNGDITINHTNGKGDLKKKKKEEPSISERITIEDLEKSMKIDIIPKLRESNLPLIKEETPQSTQESNRGSFASWFGIKPQSQSQPQLQQSHSQPQSPPTIIAKEHMPFEKWLTLYEDNEGRSEQLRIEILSEKPKKRKITLKGVRKDLYEAKPLPPLDAQRPDRDQLFKEKLRLCRAICDFNDMTRVKLQMIKKKEELLSDLSEFISRQHWFSEELFEECLKTISVNLFRTLPYQFRAPSLMFFHDEVFEKEAPYEDPAWRHLKLVYDVTWRVINTQHVTAQIMEKYLPGSFLRNLVELFASEDHRERAYLMMILHKIYGRCLKLRPHIIDLMCNYLYQLIHSPETDHFNGVIEVLQIVCAIIPGLTVPVKDTWQKFLRNILVPLHKCRGLKKFWEQLTQCCVNYVAKDGEGGAVILRGLLRYWPKQSPQKEEIFIMEVVNIINVLINHHDGFVYATYKPILVAASRQLTECMLSTRQPVAERAIAAWREPSMQQLVDYDRKAFLPSLMEAFFRNRSHSNQQLRASCESVEKIYRSKDNPYWKKMQQYLARKETREKDAEEATSLALAYGVLPPFPFKTKQRAGAETNETPTTDWTKSHISSEISNSTTVTELESNDGDSINGNSSIKPPIPSENVTSGEDTNGNHNNDADNNNVKKKRPYDSFALFTLETLNNLDYSPLAPNVKKYEKEVAQQKLRYLTKSERQTRRRTNWELVKRLADEKSVQQKKTNTKHS